MGYTSITVILLEMTIAFFTPVVPYGFSKKKFSEFRDENQWRLSST